MNSVKCPQCGLVNWAAAATCERCGTSLENVSSDAFVSVAPGDLPYQQPQQWMSGAPFQAVATEQALKTWKWYVFYCVLMALVYLFCVGGGFFILSLNPDTLGRDATEMQIQGIAFLVIGLVFLIPYTIAPFLEKKPWVWIYGLVLIAIGMTSCCLWPITIPLLIQWIKPEMKALFGRQ